MATLEEQTTVKERELQALRECVALANKENIKSVENELAEERCRLSQLRADFDYNLGLLSQRDEELSWYEEMFAGVRRVLNSMIAENSQLKAQLAETGEQLSLAREGREEVRRQYTQRLHEVHTRMQSIQALQRTELDKERGRLRESQRELEQKMADLEGNLACQRDEVTSHFEQILRERESEYETRISDLRAALSASEDKLRKTLRELEVTKSALGSLEEESRGKGAELLRIEKEVREREWALEDQRSLQEGVVRDLERRLAQSEAKLSRQAQEFVQRHSELDRRLREKETALRSARDAHTAKLTAMEEQVSSLTGLLQTRASEISQLQCHLEECRRERETQAQRCREEVEKCRREGVECVERCRRECVERVEEVTGEVVTRDLRLEAMKDQCDHLRSREEQTSRELERCKLELESKVRFELEQKKTIQQLTSAQDKLVAECRELKGKLSSHKNEASNHVTELSDHVTEPPPAREIAQLQQQNVELLNIIHQMRTEQETAAEPTNQISVSYVQYMERELQELKSRNRELEVKVQSKHVSAEKPPRSPTVEKQDRGHVTSDRSHMICEHTHRSHVIALSNTIAALQQEKGGVEVELKQVRTRAHQLEGHLQELKEKLYSLKSCQVPQSKVHQKLVHATHVIIALLREKEQLVQQAAEVKGQSTVPRANAGTQTEALESTEQMVQTEHITTSARDSPPFNGQVQPIIRDFPSTSGEYPSSDFHFSMGSLKNVFEQEVPDSDSPRHTSTPTRPHPLTHPQTAGPLELVSHKARGSVCPGPKFKGQQQRRPLAKKNESQELVRNYNIKD